MKHSPRLPSATEQAYANDTPLLLGYDPLQEIYQWNMISVVLLGELLLVCVALVPLYNNLSLMASDSIWGIRPSIIIPFLLLLFVIPHFFKWKRYRSEKQQREILRREALSLSAPDQALTQSRSSLHGLSLPIEIESRQKSFFSIQTIFGICFLIVLLMINYVTVLAGSWEMPSWFMIVPTILGVAMVPSLYVGIGRTVRLRIAGHYLLPSLKIDDEAITARYQHDTISISWRDVRYFGLVSSATFFKLPGKQGTQNPPEREAFEISDSENSICWLKASPFRSHRLFWFGEVELSDKDYAAFTQQLASIIMERTGLPLYDLRLAKHKPR